MLRSMPWVLLALLSVEDVCAQSTFFVSGNPALSLDDAVTAAEAGDLVILQGPGAFLLSSPMTRGIRLIGQGSPRVLAATSTPIARNVPVGERLVVRGIEVERPRAEDCAGQVVFRDLLGFNNTPIEVINCQNVVIEGYESTGFASLRPTHSNVVAVDCRFIQGGALVESSNVEFIDCHLSPVAQPTMPNRPAIIANASTIRLIGGVVQTTFQAELFGPSFAVAAENSVVEFDPTVELIPFDAPPILAPTINAIDEPSAVVRTEPESLAVKASGTPGAAFATVLGYPSPTPPWNSPFGDLWLDPLQLVAIDSGVFPDSRESTLTLSTVGVPPGLVVAIQVWQIGDSGLLFLSNPSMIVTD